MHGVAAPPSSVHANVALLALEWNVNDADVELVSAGGALSM